MTPFVKFEFTTTQGNRTVVEIHDFGIGNFREDLIPKGRPWIDRAETTAKVLFSGNNGETLAKKFLNLTHPSGTNSSLNGITVEKEGGVLICNITVAWKGGVLGTKYSTTFQWKCTKNGHLAAKISADNAVMKVAPKNLKAMEEYFRTEVFPSLIGKSGE